MTTEATGDTAAVSDNTTSVIAVQPTLKFVADIAQPPPAPDTPVEHAAPPLPEVAPPPPPVQPVEARVEPLKPAPVKAEAKAEEADVTKDRYAELVDRALRKERLAYLKRLGINSALMSDEHILALSPDVDVETPEGKITIDEWRVAPGNEKLFLKKEASEIDLDALTADYKPSKYNTFPKELFYKTLQRLAGK